MSDLSEITIDGKRIQTSTPIIAPESTVMPIPVPQKTTGNLGDDISGSTWLLSSAEERERNKLLDDIRNRREFDRDRLLYLLSKKSLSDLADENEARIVLGPDGRIPVVGVKIEDR